MGKVCSFFGLIEKEDYGVPMAVHTNASSIKSRLAWLKLVCKSDILAVVLHCVVCLFVLTLR